RKPEKKFKKDFEVAKGSWQDLPESRRELLKTLCLFELTKKQVERVANSSTRREAGIKATDSDIVENSYILCEQDEGGKDSDSIGLEQIDHGMIPRPDVAKSWSERVPITPRDKRRVRALLVDVLRSAARDGDTLLSLEEALARVRKRLPEERICNPDPELILGLSDFYRKALDFDPKSEHPFVALRQLRKMEIEVSEKVKDLVRFKQRPPTKIDWKKKLEKEFGAIDMTHLGAEVETRAREEKALALEKMFVNRFSILTGRAGTGKTRTSKILLQTIKEKSEDVLLLAPTGKARVRLQKMTGIEAETIHQFLNKNKWIRSDTYTFKESGGKKVSKSTVLIDEASMIALDLLATMFRALNFHAIKRFILIGDPNQLPPIGPGRAFIDIVNWLNEDDERRSHLAYLHERARQEKTDSEAIKLSDGYTRETPMSNDDEILSDIALGYDNGDLEVHIWNDASQMYSILKERMNELLDLDSSEKSYVAFNKSLGIESENGNDPESWQILSPVRMRPFGTTEINRKIQRKYRKGLIESAKRTRKMPNPFGDQQIVWTDKVIQLVNCARTAWHEGRKDGYVANGEIGYVKFTSKGRKRYNDCLDTAFSSQPPVTYRYYRPEVDENLELAYAITVHKAQGSDFEVVFLVIPQKAMTLSRELFYTGLTRFKKKLVLLVEKDITSLREFRSLSRSETVRRNTNLFKPIVRPEDVELPYPENLIHRTLTNVLVRSKSEVVVANILTKLGIEYEYEKPLEFAPNDFRLPDFTIHYEGKTYYWEHLGMLNLPSYMWDWMQKKKWYEKHNLLGKVITSQDGPDGAIDSIDIEKIAKDRILKAD
ncbi:MAG: AAA family ATPase, partial [Candidatus Bathyarchaeota archaeon]|nr:AAA family ATPase [Candidatus Bathyarchaeota archaeon]